MQCDTSENFKCKDVLPTASAIAICTCVKHVLLQMANTIALCVCEVCLQKHAQSSITLVRLIKSYDCAIFFFVKHTLLNCRVGLSNKYFESFRTYDSE